MRLPCALAALLLLASGCSEPGDVAGDALDGVGGDGAGPGVAGADAPTVEEVVYEHSEVVAGAGPSNPAAGDLPLPPAKVDTFTVPEGALELDFEGSLCDGSGTGGIEVVGPDGSVVWRSDSPLVYGGAPMVGCAGLYSPGEGSGDAPAAGEYTVNYRIAGAFTATVKVTAEMPAPAAAGPAEG